MDKTILAEEIRKVIASFEKEGKYFEFAALVPTYRGDSKTSYIFQVSAEWLVNMSTPEFTLIIQRLYELLEDKFILYINRVNIYKEYGDIQALPGDVILINKIGYQPEVSLLRKIQAAVH